MAKVNIDDKRYRYFITDKDRAKRIFNKDAQTILEHLGKDAQHKLNKLNEKWYNTGEEPDNYIRVANTKRRGGSILKNNGYRVIDGDDTEDGRNVLDIYYAPRVTKTDNAPFGGSTFGQGIKKGGYWTPHGWNDIFDFEGYIDFIETGTPKWIDTSVYWRNHQNEAAKKATHATEELYKWWNNEVQPSAIQNQLYVVAQTALMKSIRG